MWAQEGEDGRRRHFGAKRYVELYGGSDPVVPVRLIEDPEGDYHGWMEKGTDVPCLIWGALIQLDICFSNGLAGAVEAGRGQPIRLRCKPITDTHTHA